MYDTIIVGGGPAGLTAGIYLRRAGRKTLILEKETIGGQISSSPLVENYPGIKSISGSELSFNLYNQAIELGAEIEVEEVEKIEKQKVNIKVKTDYSEYKTKTLIIATGAKYRKLGLPKEEELSGSGIHFCATCDGPFYKDKVVAVIGGANTAVTNALYLSDLASKVYLIYRKDKLRAEKTLVEKIKAKKNVEIIYDADVKEILGVDKVTGLVLDIKGKTKEIELDGIFEAIGVIPATKPFDKLIKVKEDEYFDSEDTKTEIDGIFVAGDCRSKKVRQLTTATSDGTIAATEAILYLQK